MNIDHQFDSLIFELTEAHNQLNKLCFEGKLNSIKITVEHKKRSDSRKLASFISANTNLFFNNEKSIIVIYTSSLNGNFELIIRTLIHEMIHQYCFENDIVDSYDTNKRHNKNFKKIGEWVGFLYLSTSELKKKNNLGDILDRKLHGYSSENDITAELRNVINNLDVDKALFSSLKHNDSNMESRKEIKKFNVYSCNCDKKIRSESILNIMCLNCNKKFILI